MRSTKVSVVMPAYNEAKSLPYTLPALHRFIERTTDDFEVLIVDDGSTDNTPEVVEETIRTAKLSTRNIEVIKHGRNIGYGGALRSGFYKARHDWVLLYPSDGQFNVKEIELLFTAMKKMGGGPAVVWGYRLLRAEGFIRRFLQERYQRLIDKRLGVSVRDIDCGFKLYHRQIFYKIPTLTSDGALIDAEILYHCRQLDIPIREIGVNHLKRRYGKASGLKPSVVMNMFKELRIFADKVKK